MKRFLFVLLILVSCEADIPPGEEIFYNTHWFGMSTDGFIFVSFTKFEAFVDSPYNIDGKYLFSYDNPIVLMKSKQDSSILYLELIGVNQAKLYNDKQILAYLNIY